MGTTSYSSPFDTLITGPAQAAIAAASQHIEAGVNHPYYTLFNNKSK